MASGKPKKNRRGKTKTTTLPPPAKPTKTKHVPPQPAQRFLDLDNDALPAAPSDIRIHMNQDNNAATSPDMPSLTANSPTPGRDQLSASANTENPFNPADTQGGGQNTASTTRAQGKRKRVEPSQGDPNPQTPARPHLSQLDAHPPQGVAGQRRVSTSSTLPNIQATTFSPSPFSPSQQSNSQV